MSFIRQHKNPFIALILVLVFVTTLYADVKFSEYARLTQATGDDLVLVTNDPNGVPVTKAVGRDELLMQWTGSTAIATLGTITTGVWNAGAATSSGTITSSGTFDVTGATGLTLGSADVTGFTVTTDGTGNAEFTLPNDVIGDADIDWGAGAGQVDLADIPGGTAGASAFNFAGATSLSVVADEAADATLTALGQIHVRGDEDRFSLHLGAGGEIAGEATKSMLYYISVRFDPGAWYDSDAEVFLFTIKADQFPNGIIIDEWSVSCNVDPDVEMDLDLKYADAWIGLANSAVIDVLDTLNGVSSEDTDANINGGVAVAVGKVTYLSFGADPEGTGTQMVFEMWFHAEED